MNPHVVKLWNSWLDKMAAKDQMPRSCGALEQPAGKVEKNVAQVSVFCISTYMTVNKCQVFYDGISK